MGDKGKDTLVEWVKMRNNGKNEGLAVIQIIPRNIHFPPSGGDAVRVHSQSRAVAKNGCRVNIICFAARSDEQRVDLPNVLLYPIAGEVTVISSQQRFRRDFSILRILRDFSLFFVQAFLFVRREGRDPCVMHAHTPEGGMIALGLKFLTGKPFIYDPHDWHFEKWILVYVDVSLFSRKILSFAYRILASVVPRVADVTIAVSESMSRCIPHARLRQIVPNAIDPNHIQTLRRTMPKQAPGSMKRIVFAGSIAKHQGLKLLLDAFSNVCSHRSDVELWIIGSGEYLSSCKLLARKLRISNKIRFLGRHPQNDTLKMVAQADVCVAPFLPESFCMTSCPIKILEYAALGKKIVTTNLPFIRDLLGDYQVAFLSQPNQVELTQKLLQALEFEPPDSARNEKGDLSFSIDRFTDNFVATTLMKLYRAVLAQAVQ